MQLTAKFSAPALHLDCCTSGPITKISVCVCAVCMCRLACWCLCISWWMCASVQIPFSACQCRFIVSRSWSLHAVFSGLAMWIAEVIMRHRVQFRGIRWGICVSPFQLQWRVWLVIGFNGPCCGSKSAALRRSVVCSFPCVGSGGSKAKQALLPHAAVVGNGVVSESGSVPQLHTE